MHHPAYRGTAFTLIELLIVVAIIGILAAIAVPNFLNAQMRAQIAKVKGDMRALGSAIETYRIDHNRYPFFDAYALPARYNSITYRLISLTTPLAYIGSVDLQDPFLKILPAEGYEDEMPRESYNYRSYETFNPELNIKAWALNSMGPDRTADKGLQVELWARGLVSADTVLIYDTTNGLVSRGDMPYTGGESRYQANF